jgi:TatD DNase family protein
VNAVDSHCHLADPVFAADLEDVVARALDAGVTRALCVIDAGSQAEATQWGRVHARWPAARAAVGIHPHQAGTYAGRAAEVSSVVAAALDATPGVRAIGEIGLDFHYDFAPPGLQREVLAAQVRLARARDLPVVVHAREAEGDVLDVLAAEGGAGLRGVFHCYTGDLDTARRVLDRGYYLGVGGIVTFPRGDNVRALLRVVPPDRLLVETDSPFLAPVPHRGRRNEPAWVVAVAERIAAETGETPEAVAARTAANFDALFGP